jgi:hypothetical protein
MAAAVDETDKARFGINAQLPIEAVQGCPPNGPAAPVICGRGRERLEGKDIDSVMSIL